VITLCGGVDILQTVPDCVLPVVHVPVLHDSVWDLGDHHGCEVSGVPTLGLARPHRATYWCYCHCIPRLLFLCHSAQHRGAYISLCQVLKPVCYEKRTIIDKS